MDVSSEDFSAEDLDLQKEIHPLSSYLDDREKLLEEIFASVHKDVLQKLIPTSLKGLSLDELKRKCLQQLILLPTDSILDIISNDPKEAHLPTETSDTGNEDELIIDNGDEDIDNETIETFEASFNAATVPPQVQEGRIDDAGSSEWLSNFTKTQMDILELEMRARAIRSLMKAQGLNSSDDTS